MKITSHNLAFRGPRGPGAPRPGLPGASSATARVAARLNPPLTVIEIKGPMIAAAAYS